MPDVPNVFWGSITLEELRTQPLVRGLPPLDHVKLLEPSSFRLVRQESRLWSALHKGVLTTSQVNAALGLYEPKAARKLGLRHSVGHGALLAVYTNLCQQPWWPSSGQWASELEAQLCGAAPVPAAPVPAAAATAAIAAPAAPAAAVAAAPTAEGAQNTPATAQQLISSSARRRRRRRGPQAARAVSGFAPEEAVLDVDAKKASKARSVAARGIGAVRCAWGSCQEAASLAALTPRLPAGSSLEEVGLCTVDPQALRQWYGYPEGALPPMGASPDGLLRHTTSEGAAAGVLRGEPQEHEGSHALLDTLRLGCAPSVLEVVELKNVCPFHQQRALTRRGKPQGGRYVLADPGPRAQVLPQQVPQLQLEMLSAPAQSALLVSRSATKGMHVFRMRRSEEFLRLMLRLLAQLQACHVAQGVPPPPDLFWGQPEYHRLLQLVQSLAREAQLLAWLPSGSAAADPQGAFLSSS